jgi:dTDP-4-dehydrorhamnose reductase
LPAIRPHNSLLKTQKICNTFSIHLPHWKVPLKRTLQEIYL